MFGVNGASRGFLGRRLLRIVPLYWAMTTAILIMLFKLRGQLPDSSLILKSYLFIPVVHNGWQSEPILGVGWTLNHEMFFYACFAVAIMLPRRLAVLALSVALFAFTNAGSYFGFMMHAPLSVWAASFVCEFCFGMWIAAAYREGVRIPVVASVAVSAVGLALMIYTHIEAFTVISRVMGWGGGAALVVAGIVLADTTRKVPRVFRPLIILGRGVFRSLSHSLDDTECIFGDRRAADHPSAVAPADLLRDAGGRINRRRARAHAL
jgi:exopolysaccharide production protein ExoZ